MELTRIPHPAPTPDADRVAAIADPGFGTLFTDHMITVDYDEGQGWHSPRLVRASPFRSIRQHRCCTTLRKFSKA